MTPLLVVGSVAGLLAVLTWIGPFLIRSAAPVLMRWPRVAALGLLAIPALWLSVIAAVSLMTAWLLKGPDILPIVVADVCQRCLAAASPFPDPSRIETWVPAVAFLLLPLGLLLVAACSGARRVTLSRRSNSQTAERLQQQAVTVDINGIAVNELPYGAPLAFSLPAKYGGVVISRSLCEILEPNELTAVLEHERAHVDQGHHRLLANLHAFVKPMAFLPVFAEVVASVPLYLEIAADDRARRTVGTASLASALIKIGQTPVKVDRLAGPSALGIAGPDLIRQLVSPAGLVSGIVPLIALGSILWIPDGIFNRDLFIRFGPRARVRNAVTKLFANKNLMSPSKSSCHCVKRESTRRDSRASVLFRLI